MDLKPRLALRARARWVCLGCLAASGVAVALFARAASADPGGRAEVGPWDTGDIPPPTATLLANLIPDPPKSIEIRGGKAELPGLTIEFHGISRTASGVSPGLSVNTRSWTPDGGRYDGPELDDFQPLYRSSHEGDGARYLDFGITSTVAEPVLLYGYVPQSAQVGTEPPEERGLTTPANCDFSGMSAAIYPKGFRFKYRPAVVVKSNRADRFLLGVAQGPWIRLAGYAEMPADVVEGSGLAGAWGKTEVKVVNPPVFHGERFGVDSHRPPAGPTVTITVRPSREPREYAYRVRLYARGGGLIPVVYRSKGGSSPTFDEASCSLTDWKRAARMDIEGRKLVYLDFRHVHYYPDARLWPEMRWGREGFEDAQKIEGIGRFDGIASPGSGSDPSRLADFYTPKGVLWAEYPDRQALPGFGQPTSEDGRQLAAVFSRDSGVVNAEAAEFVVFSSSSATPGQGLDKRIGQFGVRFQSDRGAIAFQFPQASQAGYVQIRVRKPNSEWRSVGTAKPPAGPFVGRSGAELARSRDGSPLVTALSVDLNLAGELSFRVTRPDLKVEDQPRLLSWDPESKQIRLILRLRSGRRIVLYTENAEKVGATPGSGNVTTTCSVCHEFHVDDSGEPSLVLPWSAELTTGGRPSEKSIRLGDVDGFEVETRALSAPVYVVAKLPPPDSKDASRNDGAVGLNMRRP